MKKTILLLLLLFVGQSEASACLNYYYTVDKHGHTHNAENVHLLFDVNFNKHAEQKKLVELKARLKQEKSWQLLSDYAVCLLKLGETARALEIFIELEKHFPNEYQLAANLGTAYELSGQNENALKYIQKGIKLNPDAHGGSEWIHVKIIEAKIAMQKDPGFLENRTVLGLTEKQQEDTLVRNQIVTQLKERFPFTPAPDVIVASLLIDLGDCLSHTISFEHAKSVYTLAKEHHGASDATVDARIAEMVKLRTKYKNVPTDYINNYGFNQQVTGVRYKELLNTYGEYSVTEWTTINTPKDTLLAYCGLAANNPASKSLNEKSVDEKPASSTMLYLGFGLISLFLLIGLFFFFKRKSEE